MEADRAGWLRGRAVRFALVGTSGVIVNSAALAALHGGLGLPLLLASALAVEIAIIHNFVWNNRWTFGQRRISLARFARFNAVSLGGLAIATGTLHLLVRGFGLYYLLANLIGIGLAMTWNFLLSQYWAWGSLR